MDDRTLKPCPFCGGEARSFSRDGVAKAICDRPDFACCGGNVSATVEQWNTRAADRLSEREGWREIESAPKDGTIFDAWAVFECPSHKSGARYVSARYVPEKDRWEDSCGNNIQYLQLPDEDGWWQTRYLTHWMPLPSPPGKLGR